MLVPVVVPRPVLGHFSVVDDISPVQYNVFTNIFGIIMEALISFHGIAVRVKIEISGNRSHILAICYF